jgi:uncharacterized cupin superfamily protein
MKAAIDLMDLPSETGQHFPEPFRSTLGPYEGRALGDYFGLTHFGVAVDILPPNSQSALRHWHTRSDELVLMLEGELTLITDAGESLLKPGMCAGFKSDVDNGHHLVNRSSAPAKYLVIGSRVSGDEARYPDDDFQWVAEKDGSWYAARKDGTRY